LPVLGPSSESERIQSRTLVSGIGLRSKLVIKDHVAVIVFNNKEAEKLAADIKEKIACAESSGMAGQREYDSAKSVLGPPRTTQSCAWCL
jgi:hypothetical protein